MSTILRQAFDQRLAQVGLDVPIVWMNEPADVDGMFVRPTLLPNQPTQYAMGEDAPNDHEGEYQIDVFTPMGTGIGHAEDVIALIRTHFKRGSIIEYQGHEIRITMVGDRHTRGTDKWQQSLLQVDYRAQLPK